MTRPHTTPFTFARDESFRVGRDTGTPVDEAGYQVGATFTGKIGKATVELGTGPVSLESMNAWIKAASTCEAERPAPASPRRRSGARSRRDLIGLKCDSGPRARRVSLAIRTAADPDPVADSMGRSRPAIRPESAAAREILPACLSGTGRHRFSAPPQWSGWWSRK